MLPNSPKQAFEPRNFSKRSNDDPSRTTTTTDAYFSFSVSAYSADVKLYVLHTTQQKKKQWELRNVTR